MGVLFSQSALIPIMPLPCTFTFHYSNAMWLKPQKSGKYGIWYIILCKLENLRAFVEIMLYHLKVLWYTVKYHQCLFRRLEVRLEKLHVKLACIAHVLKNTTKSSMYSFFLDAL